MDPKFAKRPVRVGIFDTVQEADRVVAELLAARFSKKQISVVCSDKAVADHFVAEGLHEEKPAGTETPKRALVGGAIGSALGGLAFVGLATATGLGIVAAGALLPAVIGGGTAGSLVGAMTSRGVEPEAADFYDQSLERGRLLVVVEEHGDASTEDLAVAEKIFAENGAMPIPLADG
jgi:hypothetical protein